MRKSLVVSLLLAAFLLSAVGAQASVTVTSTNKQLTYFSELKSLYFAKNGTLFTAGQADRVDGILPSGKNVFSINSPGTGVGQFKDTAGIAEAENGDLLITDRGNNRIQRYTSGGTYVTQYISYGPADDVRLVTPRAVVQGANGNLWISEHGKDRVTVTTPNGTNVMTLGTGTYGSENGTFNNPGGMAFAPNGSIAVVDIDNHRVQYFSSAGLFQNKMGSYSSSGNDGFGSYVRFVDAVSDGLVVSDTHRVTKFNKAGAPLFSIGSSSYGSGNSEFSTASGVATDTSGNIYVADRYNHRIQKFSSSGAFISKWGTQSGSFQAGVYFNEPFDLAMDSQNNLYVANANWERVNVFSNTGTYKSAGYSGYNQLWGIHVDSSDRLWVADHDGGQITAYANGTSGSVYMTINATDMPNLGVTFAPADMALSGNILWIANQPSSSSEDRIIRYNISTKEFATYTCGSNPLGVSIDSDGLPWIAYDGAGRAEKRNASGSIIAVRSEYGTAYDNKYSSPQDIVYETDGSYWISDAGNDRVLGYDSSGNLKAKIGGSDEALLNSPHQINFDSNGKLWVTSFDNDRVYRINPANTEVEVTISSSSVSTGGGDLDGAVGVVPFTYNSTDYVLVTSYNSNDVHICYANGTFYKRVDAGGESSAWNQFDNPVFATVTDDEILIIDRYYDRVKIYRKDGTFKRSITTTGASYNKVRAPEDIFWHPTTKLFWIADSENSRVLMMDDTGTVVRVVGGPYSGIFSRPNQFHLRADGTVLVADYSRNTIVHVDSMGNMLDNYGKYAEAGKLNAPQFVLPQSDGSVWVADSNSHRILHRAANGSTIALFGGYSSSDNTKFSTPIGIALLGDNVIIADHGQDKLKKFTKDGTYVSVFAATGAVAGAVDAPYSLKVDNQNRLWVVEGGNNDRVQAFDENGTSVLTLGSGTLNEPWGVAFDADGNVWVTSSGNHQVYKFAQNGSVLLQLGKSGNTYGSYQGEFNNPTGITVDNKGRVHVADRSNSRIQVFNTNGVFQFAYALTNEPCGMNSLGDKVWHASKNDNNIRKYSSDGRLIGSFSQNGLGFDGFREPYGVAEDENGMLWVADRYNNRLVKFDPKTQQVLNSTNSWLNSPRSVRIGPDKNIWVADFEGAGAINVYSPTGKLMKHYYDTGQAFEGLYQPKGTCVHNGTIYIADYGNHRIVAKDMQGNTLRTMQYISNPWDVAIGPNDGLMYVVSYGWDQIRVYDTNGTYVRAMGGTGRLPGTLDYPYGIAFDKDGNLLVVDTYSNRLYRYSTDGTFIGTIVTESTSDDTKLDDPRDVVVDKNGNIYVLDNGRFKVYANDGTFQYSFPTNNGADYATIDDNDVIWVTEDGYNNRVRAYDTSGNLLFTMSGSGSSEGQSDTATGISVDGSGRIWVADGYSGKSGLQVFTIDNPSSISLGLQHRNWRDFNATVAVVDVIPGAKAELEVNAQYTFGSAGGSGDIKDFKSVSWSSSNEAVATVTSGGIVTAVKEGNATISATVGGAAYNATFVCHKAEDLPVMVLGNTGSNVGTYNEPVSFADNGTHLFTLDNENRRVLVLDYTGNIVNVIRDYNRFNDARDIHVEGGFMYVASLGNHRIYKFKTNGEYVMSYGSYGAGDGQLHDPRDVDVVNGTLYVADNYNNRLVIFSEDGTFNSTIGVSDPYFVFVEPSGNIITNNNYDLIRLLPNGTKIAESAGNDYPRTIWLDEKGDYWVRTSYNYLVKYNQQLEKLMSFQSQGSDQAGKFDSPTDIVSVDNGTLWVCDNSGDRLQRLRLQPKAIKVTSQKNVLKDSGPLKSTMTWFVTDDLKPTENVSAKAKWTVDNSSMASVDANGTMVALGSGKVTAAAEYRGLDDNLTLYVLKYGTTSGIDIGSLEKAHKLELNKAVENDLSSGNNDYYFFNATQGGAYEILFTTTASDSAATLYFLNSTGGQIAYTSIQGGSTAIPVLLPAGEWYIRLSGSAEETYYIAMNAEDLTINPDNLPRVALGEPYKGLLFFNQSALYQLILKGPSHIQVDYGCDSNVLDTDITFYPEEVASNTKLDTVSSNNGENASMKLSLAPGKYHVQVSPKSFSSSNQVEQKMPFTLKIGTYEFTGVSEFEPNNTPLTPNTIKDNEAVTGRNSLTGYYSSSDLDFYTFHYAPVEGTPLLLNLEETQPNVGKHKVEIRNLENKVLATYSSTLATDKKVALNAGQYYLVVKDDDSSKTEYKLTVAGGVTPDKKVTGVQVSTAEDVPAFVVGQTYALNATVFFSDGSAEINPDTSDLTIMEAKNWASTDPTVVSVGNPGSITLKKAGTAIVTASVEGKIGKLTVSTLSDKAQDYGNLIVVAGGGIADSNKLKDITQYLCDTTYLKFKGRGFEDEDIFYFNPQSFKDLDGNGFNDGIVDESSVTIATFAKAINSWATEADSSGPLFLYLNDHGANGQFQLYPGQILTAATLNQLLDLFQSKTGRQVILIIEACHAGTFVEPLQDDNRIVITSTDEKVAFLGDGGSASFSQPFMGALYKGASIGTAFTTAKTTMDSLGKPYSGQIPQMYPETLGSLDQHIVGDFALAPLFPEIDMTKAVISETINMANSESLSIKVPVTGVTGGKVWATIREQGYEPPAVEGNFSTPEIELPSVELFDQDDSGNMDGVFNATYSGFTKSGYYEVVIFARDPEGNLAQSPVKKVWVSQSGEEPSGFDLNLTANWNLLSTLTPITVSTTFASSSSYTSVWVFDSGKWEVYLPEQDTQAFATAKGFTVLSTIDPGEGFWVNSAGTKTVQISGSQSTSGSIDLSSGWNLVGLKSSSSKTVTELLGSNSAQVESMWKWVDQKWSVHFPNESDNGAAFAASKGMGTFTTINSGEGFWISAKQAISVQ